MNGLTDILTYEVANRVMEARCIILEYVGAWEVRVEVEVEVEVEVGLLHVARRVIKCQRGAGVTDLLRAEEVLLV